MHASDSVGVILSHISTIVMEAITDGGCLYHLDYLLVFLAAWGKRHECLAKMVPEWRSAIDATGGRLGLSERSVWRQFQLQLQLQIQLQLRPQDAGFDKISEYFSTIGEEGFTEVGRSCDLANGTSCLTCGNSPGSIPDTCVELFLKTIEVGFAPAEPGINQYEWMFETAFSSNNDDIIADAMSPWIVGGDRIRTLGSYVDRLSERVGRKTPFSPRLRRHSIRVIERAQGGEERVGLETLHLLDCLNVGVGEIEDRGRWVDLLRTVMRVPEGLEGLSSHYWDFLVELASSGSLGESLTSEDLEVLEFLEEAEEWEKLEILVVIAWQTLPLPRYGSPSSMVNQVKVATRGLLLQRPSALPRLEHLWKTHGAGKWAYKGALQGVCDEAKGNRSP